jgi:hypothetical protein
MRQSDNINELAAALSSFQGEVKDISKDSQGYGYKYADLSAVFEIVRPLLLKHGLSIAQPVGGSDNRIELTTVLMHKSGQFISSAISIPVDLTNKKMNALQAAGSTITYMRRYCVCSILGLATTDDDGAAGGQVQNTPPAPKYISQPIKVEQHLGEDAMNQLRHTLMDAIMEKNIPLATVEKWCAKAGVDSVLEFNYDQIVGVNNLLEKMSKG